MTRRCSHCSHNGHNSRTCHNRGVKLFGVRLTDGSIRKSASMNNLIHYPGTSSPCGTASGSPLPEGSPRETPDHVAAADGYASEDFVPGSSSCRVRKKGVPWTEDEHRMFLVGLKKLGKGDWRGISRNYVVSRTPTQVASHAQKYFIRKSNTPRIKRRSSLFDIVPDEPLGNLMAVEKITAEAQLGSADNPPEAGEEEGESMDSAASNTGDPPSSTPEILPSCYPVLYPAYFSPFFHVPLPYRPVNPTETPKQEVLKPTAVHSKPPTGVDSVIGMSELSLRESVSDGDGAASLSLKLRDGSSRQSAFRARRGPSSSGMNSGSSPIHAL